jgi:hypothetical protein
MTSNSDSYCNNESLLYDLTRDFLCELNKPKNKKKLLQIGEYIFSTIRLYLYTIILMLILIFVMNTVQFYYYLTQINI